jgi:hypothetical protein
LKNLFRFKHLFLSAFFLAMMTVLVGDADAQTGRTKTIRFERGKYSAVLKNAVVRGTADRYIVRAKKGQTMSVKVMSVENNARFTVYFSGEQESLESSEEASRWTGKLSGDNDYVIVVSPTRGNATYTLTVSVR